MSEFITQSAFARRRGWSAAYVSKLKRKGRLVLTQNGLVDVAASIYKIERLRDAARGGDRTGKHAAAAAEAFARPLPSASVDGSPQDVPDTVSYREAARRERIAKARLAELELAEARGALTRRDRGEITLFAIPYRLAAKPAGTLAAAPDRANALRFQFADGQATRLAALNDAVVREWSTLVAAFHRGGGDAVGEVFDDLVSRIFYPRNPGR